MIWIKNITFIFIISSFIVISFSACSTTTSITSWKDNSEIENKFHKILVMVFIKDLEYKSLLETKVANELKKLSVNAVKSLDVLSPLEKYSKDDLDTLLQKNNFDGLLTINYEGSVQEKGNGIKYYKYYKKFFNAKQKKRKSIAHSTIILESILFSVNSENNIWTATTKTEDASNAEDLANSVAEALIQDLIKNKLINNYPDKK